MFVVETSPAGGPPGAGAVVAGTSGMVVLVSERVRSAVMPRSGWDSRVVYAVEAALSEDWFCAEDSAEIEIEIELQEVGDAHP